MSEQQPETPPTFAVVELMGHVKLAGRLTEEEKFGGKLGRLDIPSDGGWTTQYFGASSVYRITVVTEGVARQVARQTNAAPVGVWDYPKNVPARISHYDDPADDPMCGRQRDEDEQDPDDYEDDVS